MYLQGLFLSYAISFGDIYIMKFEILHKILFVFLIVTLFASCSSIYMPNVPATPMFRNKGEGHLAGHIGLKGNVSANAGIAISDKIAIVANGSSINRGANSNDKYSQWLGEGSVGYFTTLGKRKLQVFEAYIGYGVGSSEDIDQRASVIGFIPVDVRKINFNRIFAQVNYSSTKRDKINLFGEKRELNYGTAIRLSRVGTSKLVVNDVVLGNEYNLFIEPIFFTRLQLTKGLDIQYTTGFNVGFLKNEYLKSGNSVFTLGITYNFGKK